MKNISKNIVAGMAFAASTFASLGAQAHDWNSVYLGIGVGAGAIVHEVDVSLPPFASLNFNGIGGEGAFFTGQVGADWQVAPQFVVGAFFDYDFSGIETDASLSVPIALLNANAAIKVDNQWALGARFGFLPTASRSTLWYLSVGYTELNMDDITAGASIGGVPVFNASLAMPDFKGYFVGGGVETMLTSNISMKAEYRYSEFDRKSIFAVPGLLDVGLEPSMHTARLAVNYKFPLRRSAHEIEPLK